jgi:predicted ATP-dependent endonuclease of OLD family
MTFTLAQIRINNFRGIQDFSTKIPQGEPLHIIGSNNAGKSTILEAFAFALRAGGFHQYDLDNFDFFSLMQPVI